MRLGGDVLHHSQRVPASAVEHRGQETSHLQARIEPGPDVVDGGHDAWKLIRCEELGLNGDDHFSRAGKGARGEALDRRRAIQQHEIEARKMRRESALQRVLAVLVKSELGLRFGDSISTGDGESMRFHEGR